MIKITNVLVATDFSEASVAALAYGRELSRSFGARLHLLHVIHYPPIEGGPDAIGVDFSRIMASLESGAHEALERILTNEDRQQLEATAMVRTGHSVAVEVARYAKDAHIDVLIVGTHGRGFMGHLLMGNVAERLVRIAPCPVLTVRHPEREFILPDALQAFERTSEAS